MEGSGKWWRYRRQVATVVFVGAKEIRCRPWPYEAGQESRVAEKKAPAKKKVAEKRG